MHNHARSRGLALEDIWKTLDSHRYQFAGITGFCLTNDILTVKHSKDGEIIHPNFKMRAANAMTIFQDSSMFQRKSFLNISHYEAIHSFTKFSYLIPCFYCQIGYDAPVKKMNLPSFKCEHCSIPLYN